MKILLIALLIVFSAAQRNSEDETWRLFQDHREALEDNDPGLIDKGKEPRHQDPDHELDKIKTTDKKNWLDHDIIAALVGGGISIISVVLFILRLIQKIREIRRAGEGMGDLLLDLIIALLSFVRRRQNAPIDA